jgi:predicted outer membrane repeat protein
MESKLFFLKRAFADVYGPGYTNIEQYSDPKYTSRITPTSNNVYVHNCVFQDCSSSSSGGAIYCGSTVYKFLVEQTSFTSCKTSSGNGGAIYFYSTSYGECVLSKICGFDCSPTTSSSGQFAYTYTKNDVTCKHHINDSSITRSINMNTNTYDTLYLEYGTILCPSVNLTNNVCYYYVAIRTFPTKGSGSPASETCFISYSSIVNNTNNGGYGCIVLDRVGSSQSINTCNIINNKQTSSSYGTIYVYANVFIKDSCILGNNENYKVFSEDYSSCKITLSNCTIDDDIFTRGRYYGSVTVIKPITKSFINALSHIATQRCDSYFDSYGTLSVKPNTPSKTLRCLISCNNICPMNDLLRYIQFIFLLTFLPSDPAKGYYFDSNHLF